MYVSAIFDCFDSAVLGLSIGANMQATLCVDTLDNAMMAYPDLKGAIIHSDRSSLYMAKIVFLKKIKYKLLYKAKIWQRVWITRCRICLQSDT